MKEISDGYPHSIGRVLHCSRLTWLQVPFPAGDPKVVFLKLVPVGL